MYKVRCVHVYVLCVPVHRTSYDYIEANIYVVLYLYMYDVLCTRNERRHKVAHILCMYILYVLCTQVR